jgi:hypothetical protein
MRRNDNCRSESDWSGPVRHERFAPQGHWHCPRLPETRQESALVKSCSRICFAPSRRLPLARASSCVSLEER